MTDWNGVPLDHLEVRSERLRLRPWQSEDAPAVERIMRDSRMADFVPLPQPYTAADAAEFVTGAARSRRSDPGRLECAVTLDDQVVGAIGMSLPAAGSAAEIGYWVGSAHWGRGIATEAARALADFAFAHGVHRVQIQADTANLASLRVALRAGFAFEGIARLGRPSQRGLADHAVLARLAGDSGEPVPPSWPAPPELSDGTVSLRPVRPADWPVLYAESTNPEALAWGFSNEGMTEQAAVDRARLAGLNWLVGQSAELLICDAATGTGAGVLNLRWVGPPEVVSIGYGVLPAFRGRRFTSRALELVAAWAFEHTTFVRLELGCKVENVASARSAERAGFVRDGRLAARLRNPDGSYSDEFRYARLRPGN